MLINTCCWMQHPPTVSFGGANEGTSLTPAPRILSTTPCFLVIGQACHLVVSTDPLPDSVWEVVVTGPDGGLLARLTGSGAAAAGNCLAVAAAGAATLSLLCAPREGRGGGAAVADCRSLPIVPAACEPELSRFIAEHVRISTPYAAIAPWGQSSHHLHSFEQQMALFSDCAGAGQPLGVVYLTLHVPVQTDRNYEMMTIVSTH